MFSFKCALILQRQLPNSILTQVLMSTQRTNFLRSTKARESCPEYINSVFALSFALHAWNLPPKKLKLYAATKMAIYFHVLNLFHVLFKNSLLTIIRNYFQVIICSFLWINKLNLTICSYTKTMNVLWDLNKWERIYVSYLL